MQYLPEPLKVVYRAKDGTGEKVFDTQGWVRLPPQTNPRSCAKVHLTHNSLFCIFNPPQSEFLSVTHLKSESFSMGGRRVPRSIRGEKRTEEKRGSHFDRAHPPDQQRLLMVNP
jgi:hypothetical protein